LGGGFGVFFSFGGVFLFLGFVFAPLFLFVFSVFRVGWVVVFTPSTSPEKQNR
jgi:hypothetical protein